MKSFEERARELVMKMTLPERMSQLKHCSDAIDRLGVPAYNWWNEGLHGVARSGVATVFPQAIGMAASYNQELMQEVATAISDEARAKYNEYKQFGGTEIYQGLTYWSPNINIFRDPRWGRGHETYGEDPCLTGKMGVAFIKGLQGEGKYRKLDATIKHFAVHSGPEAIRHGFSSEVSDKDLYETYLVAFKYCIDNADPSAVMGAYNAINGHPSCGSEYVLKELLRDKLGFKGYVVSDCSAIGDLHEWFKCTKNAAESAALGLNSGCELNCGGVYEWLKVSYAQGLVSEETITEAAVKLFTARFRLGMFDDDCEYDNIPYSVVECEKHRELNREMAQESAVLLKNDGILPLKEGMKIAVIGPNADSQQVLLGNYNGIPSIYYTLLRGLQEYGKVLYAKGCGRYDEENKKIHYINANTREAIIDAKHSDVIVMCMGIDPSFEGEQGDRFNQNASGDKLTLDVPPCQQNLYEEILKLGKPIVYINVSGSCINLKRQKETANAVLQAFYPGAMGGLAIADIIFGKVSPSGRLPVTFYENLDGMPDFTDYSMENRTYKFYKGTPVYEFGYGLTYSDISEKWLDENTVEVENKGNFDTKYSVLQFEYIPHKSLKNFKKIFIKSGDKIVVKF